MNSVSHFTKCFHVHFIIYAQRGLPEIGKEVLIYKGGSRSRNSGGVSQLPLSSDSLILFIGVLRAFSVNNNLIQVILFFLRLGI